MPPRASLSILMVTAALVTAIGAGAAMGLAEEPKGSSPSLGTAPGKPVAAKPVLARAYSIGTLAP